MNWKAGFKYLFSEFSSQVRMRPIVSLFVAIWALLLVGNVAKTAFDLGPTVQDTVAHSTPIVGEQYPDTEVTQDITLGTYPGTVGEAAQLLELMANEPGHGRYTLTFSVPGEIIVFGCDLNRQRLVRIHQRPGDHGSREMWTDYIVERLQDAARGKSLNYTPAGNLPGSHDTF